MSTTFKGPVRTGTVRSADANDNTGDVLLTQQVTLTANAALQVDKTEKIPVGSRLVDIIVDVVTPFNGTAAPITIGNVAGGTQYSVAISGLATGRTRPTFTAAQLLAMASTAADANDKASSSLVASVIPTGANTTGQAVITYVYSQTQNDNAPV